MPGPARTFAIFLAVLSTLGSATPAAAASAQVPQTYLQVNGTTDFVQIDVLDSPDFSVSSAGLAVSAWMRPDALLFPVSQGTDGCKYVHWLGKGEADQQEWVFRMYQDDATNCPGTPSNRSRRISFYVFNLSAPPGQTNRGCGSYFQDPIEAGQWVHVVGVVDNGVKTVSIYKNGEWRHTDSYDGIINPEQGSAPVRMGTRDQISFLEGALAEVRVWNRPLTDEEVSDLYNLSLVPQDGLVAQYLLNEGMGDIAHDTAGTHDGRLNGTMTWGGPDSGAINNDSAQSGGGC